MRILVTGGAGFIGSHLVRALLERGHEVRVLDALVEQVHGPDGRKSLLLPEAVEFDRGDVRDLDSWRRCLPGCDAVYHLAAEVGVGQSMYDIVRYMSANTMGTANLLQLLASREFHTGKVIVASSMSIYGEGAYRCANCGPTAPQQRPLAQMERMQWNLLCPDCASELTPMATAEDKPLQPTSVYAISKRDQEELCLNLGRAYGIPTVALRFFNIYGPGQALSNPYTGVAAIFASRLLNGKPPLIFEDGNQSRDLVHIDDVVQALLLSLETDRADYEALNVGSGDPRTIHDLALDLAGALGVALQPQVINQFRQGDIRHCYADTGKAERLLGFKPRVPFSAGIQELADWVAGQTALDRVDQAMAELGRRGLVA